MWTYFLPVKGNVLTGIVRHILSCQTSVETMPGPRPSADLNSVKLILLLGLRLRAKFPSNNSHSYSHMCKFQKINIFQLGDF